MKHIFQGLLILSCVYINTWLVCHFALLVPIFGLYGIMLLSVIDIIVTGYLLKLTDFYE